VRDQRHTPQRAAGDHLDPLAGQDVRRVVDLVVVLEGDLDGESVGDALGGHPQGRVAVVPARHPERTLQTDRGRAQLRRHTDRVVELVVALQLHP
jgi:hypothetical protein